MRRALLASALAAILSVPAGTALAQAPAEDPVFTAYVAAKEAWKAKRYDDADAALRRLLELLTAPQHAGKRESVLPAYHFYAAAVAFVKKDEARASTHLASYFESQPGAELDPGSFSKEYRKFFDARREEALARRAASAPPAGLEAIAGGVLPEYATRALDDSAVPANTGDPGWADTAVAALLTERERKDYRSLPGDAARREFVARFWDGFGAADERDRFRAEFYRRAQYCDATFSTEDVRGSVSDRGRVFLVLGPPTYASRSPLQRSQDVIDRLRARNSFFVTPGGVNGEVENWVYRRDRIPKGIPFTELLFQFVTQRGYGTAVLQREPRELNAIQKAARMLRKEALPD